MTLWVHRHLLRRRSVGCWLVARILLPLAAGLEGRKLVALRDLARTQVEGLEPFEPARHLTVWNAIGMELIVDEPLDAHLLHSSDVPGTRTEGDAVQDVQCRALVGLEPRRTGRTGADG